MYLFTQMLGKKFTVVFVLQLFQHVNGSTAQTNQTASTSTSPAKTIDMKKKPVMCTFIEPNSFWDKGNPELHPGCIPQECDVVLFKHLFISNTSKITTNEKVLKQLTSMKPVIVVLIREYQYKGWGQILKPDGNKKDADVLIAFAKSHNLAGYPVDQTNPSPWLENIMNLDVAKNIVPYLQQLKYRDDFIIGLNIGVYGTQIKNPCVNDFAELNKVVDYYEINSISMNSCNRYKPTNDVSPVKLVPHGNDYLLSMEEVKNFLKFSKCDLEKVFFDAEVYPKFSAGFTIYDTYNTVCTSNDLCSWCIPSTTDYFEKGTFIKQNQFGLIVRYLNCDDLENACGCGPFIAFRNILAGYLAGQRIPCPKIDNIKLCPA